jgi:iron complex transport system substrate-binding protein
MRSILRNGWVCHTREYGHIRLPAKWLFGLFNVGGMNMRGSTFALMITCAALMIGSAFAQGIVVPGDSDGDKIVSAEEVAAAEKLAQEGKLSADDLQEIKHIHEKYPINITDSANRTVMIYKPIKSIIPMGWSQCEPVFILGETEKVAGIRSDLKESYAYIPGLKDKPTIGGWNSIDYEKVIELSPDIVIASSTDLAKLESDLHGIPYVILFRALDEDSNKKDMKTLGKILEKEERADDFISWRQKYIDLLKEKTDKIKPSERIKVYCESTNHEFYAAAKGGGVNDVISIAGGINIAGNLTGAPYFVDVSPEWVIKENPEAIIIDASMLNDPPESYLNYFAEENAMENLDEYLRATCNRTALKNTEAAKKGHIYLIQGNYAEFGRSRGIIGACYMAKWFHPELFNDLDPEKPNKEYFEEWLGAHYNGIWAYPQAS